MKRFGVALAFAIAAVGAARAADLPTEKAAAVGAAGELLCELLDLARFNSRPIAR